ncbi:MAG: aminotransferase class V-fold PLP-dependent enzyme [Acidobacteriota bacterium]
MNTIHLLPFTEAFDEFLASWPGYRETASLDDLRAREYSRLDRTGQVYLDYTGGGLYAESQVRRHQDLLVSTLLGNPHSVSPASLAATELVEGGRHRILQFFNASPDEYTLVFTANATHALKLVGESYPFGPGGRFLLTFDNHNSVNGIREFLRAKGATTTYIPVLPPDLQADDQTVDDHLSERAPEAPSLFAFPAQSNFSGVQHPLEWIARAHDRGWDVLLDAAAFAPTNRLDLSRWSPDYVSLSFYKMFGYPTGSGALIARHTALEKLRRPWFAGGTITVASVTADTHYLAQGPAAFEDGTLDYTGIPGLSIGLDHLEAVGVDIIHERVRCLAGWLIETLTSMRHTTNRPLVTLYGPRTMERRGGTLTMNFFDDSGVFIDHQEVERRASESGISLRSGCFCNPGAGELALGLSSGELQTCFARSHTRMSYNDFRRCIDGKSSGAVRVSVGIASNFADAYAFARFAAGLLR